MAKGPRHRGAKKAAAVRSINPLKVVLIGGSILVVLMVVVLLLARSSMQSWLRGDAFREWLVRQSSSALTSEIEMPVLKWQGSEAYADSFVARGYEGAAFSALSLDGVRAKAGGVRNRAFMVPDVRINRLNLLFADERLPRPAASRRAPSAEEASAGPAVPAWLKRFLPDRVAVEEVDVSSATVVVEGDRGEREFVLSGVSAVIRPDFRTDLWEMKGRNGRMSLPGHPDIQVKRLDLRWKGTDLYVDRSVLGVYGDGHVEGKGEIHFEDGGNVDLDFDISSFDVDRLVAGEWGDRLSGTVDGPVRVTGPFGELVYEGTVHVSDGEIKAVPVLERIADYTRTDQFRRLPLSEGRADFRRSGKLLELRNLAIQSDGLIRIEGALNVEGDRLAGDLQVGVTPGTMRWIPGAERSVFTEERDGFRWAPMKLAGTLAEPREDLTARLVAAAGAAIVEDLPNGILDEAWKLLGPEEGRATPSEMSEQGQRMLDLLTPFLRGR
ncbi:MAG: translocation/assembly module TamB domain-containing protein [Verrucomicrobiales bacterium]